jgi:hypothetical protein
MIFEILAILDRFRPPNDNGLFWGEFGHFGVNFSRLGDQAISPTKESW